MAFASGFATLLIAAGLSAALTADHLGALALPGCGPTSACATLAASRWGSLPGADWPLSFVGLAWFLGLLASWPAVRAGLPRALRVAIRGGAVASVMLVAVMLVEGVVCGYCLGIHAANLALWASAERMPRRDSDPARTLVPFGAMLVVSTIGLWTWRAEVERQVEEEQERALADSAARIAASPTTPPDTRAADTPVEPASSTATGSSGSGASGPWPARHRIGPEKAAVRIVVFSDYQCEDCKRVHADLERVVEGEDNVSLAAFHFPMCADCNPRFASNNMHPNACWAARAAEAAGMLHGPQAFWELGDWLFERDGSFERPELEAWLEGEGYDVPAFVATMEGEETLARVERDIQEGLRRGLHFTPMVFLNGIELEGVLAQHAVPRAVREVLASRPAPATAEADVPLTALEKYVADWRKQPRRSTDPERRALAATPADARLRIVVWGDYQEVHTGTADRILRSWAAARPDVSYSFRHFPAHSGCNTKMSRVMHPKACVAAQAAEAAAVLGDEDQYWRMHEWLFANRQRVDPRTVLDAAVELGFDRAAFEVTMASDEVRRAIDGDAQRGFPMLYHGSIPAIYIDGRVVPRWRIDGENVLETILESVY